MLSLIALVAAQAAAPATSADAVAQAAAATETYLANNQIVVTATRAEQDRAQVGQAVTVLDQQAIDLRQLPAVSDLLATTPGVTVARNGGPGQLTAVRIRGAEDGQTLVVIDGVRVNDPTATSGAFDFGSLVTDNIERIEVLRGPASVPWGSQALGGVVNIVNARPGPIPHATLRGEYGYKNQANVVGNASGTFGSIAASLGGGWYRDDSISSFRYGTERDGYRHFAGNGRVEIGIANGVSLDLRGYYANSKVGYDGFPPPTFSFADTNDYSKTEQSVGYAGLNADLGGVKNRVAFTINDINRDAFGSSPFVARGRVERYEYQGDAEIGALRLVFGAEHERPRYFDGFVTYRTHSTSGYAQAILTPAQGMALTGGLRVDDYKTYGTQVTGAANVAFTIGRTTFRAAYGSGFKAPTLYQLFGPYGTATIPGAAALQPERADSVDLGVEQGFDHGRIGVTLFGRNTRNQIDFASCFATPVPALCTQRPFGFYANVARTRARGVETFVEYRPVEGLNLAANYTFNDADNRATGQVLLRRPKHSGNVTADWSSDRFSLGGSLQVVSRSADFDYLTFARTNLGGYTLVGLRGSVKLGERFEVFARVENLFDEAYETVSGYGTLGRNAHAGVRVRL